jgi:hypothetical protein
VSAEHSHLNPTATEQGIFTTFKSCYTCPTFHSILDVSEEGTFISVTGYWKSYSTADCMVNIKGCKDDLKSVALKGCWKELWPEAVNDL